MTLQNIINAPFPLSVTKGGTGLASPTIHGIMVAEGASAMTPLVLGAGQILIGTTAGDPAIALVTAGTGISIASTSGNITISNTGYVTSPAALTEINDTNITLTLGGTPSTALLQAVSITAGWTGTLAGSRGGLGAAITANNGGIYYSNATTGALLSGTPTVNLPLLSGASSAPAWGAYALSLGGALTTSGAHTLSGAFPSTFIFTASTSVTFPTSGTLATTSQLPVPAALTEVNDTNVTLTLGGSPSTALLQATSITAGWTGTLAPIRGGTGVASPTAHGIMVAEGASAVTPIVLAAGQVLIGTTASDPAAATITGVGNITVTSTTGAIVVSATGVAAAQKGTAILNFGALPVSTASVVVTGQTGILSGSTITVSIQGSSTGTNSDIQHQWAAVALRFCPDSIVPGTGFTILATSIAGLATGTFNIHWEWY